MAQQEVFQERLEEVLRRTIPNDDLRYHIQIMIRGTQSVEFPEVLASCFRKDMRNGVIAAVLAQLFECFSKEQFLEFVDAIYDIDDMDVLYSAQILFQHVPMTGEERCALARALLPQLSEENVMRLIRVPRRALKSQDFLRLAGEVGRTCVPQQVFGTINRMSMDRQTYKARSALMDIPRARSRPMDRRMDLFRLIEHTERALPVEQFADPYEQ